MPSYSDFRPSLRFRPSLALSPDGSQVTFIDDRQGQFNLVTYSLVDGTSTTLTSFIDQTVRRVVRYPDGRSFLLTADTKGDELTQIYRVTADGEHIESLTATPAAQFELAAGPFSPDGRYLAYYGNDRSAADFDVLIRDLASGQVNRIYEKGGRMYLGHWSPDGRQLSMGLGRDGYDHVVHVISAEDGLTKRLTPDDDVAVYSLGPWLLDGSGFLVRTNAGREFIGLAILDAEDGHLTWIDEPSWDVEHLALSADGTTLVWIVNVDGVSELHARNLATGDNIKVPTLPMGQADALAVSADGSLVVALLSTPTMPWNVVAVDVEQGTVRWLTSDSSVGSTVSNLVEPSLIRYTSPDGSEISAYLYQPVVSSVPVGVLISIHGGPVHQERPAYAYDGLYQYLASQGVAVLAPNIRGSSGYGKSFSKLVYRDWGGGDLRDLAGAAAYLRTEPWVDPARLGVFGASYGGFLALLCLSRLHEVNWAAGVDMFGPSNLITLAEATPLAYRSLVVEVIGDPETDAALLIERSPMTYVDSIQAPLYVIQGANDPRVPQAESDQLVDRLRSRGVDVRYDVYPDEGHGFSKTENQVRARSDAAEFLLSHLGRCP